MLSVRGVFKNGVAQPTEPVEGYEGRSVLITFLDEEGAADDPSDVDSGWDSLLELIERCKVDTGIGDLAHQHDHYLYGRPKRP